MNRRDFCYFLATLSLSGVINRRTFADIIARHPPRRTGIVYDDIFLNHWLEEGHPESPARLKKIMHVLNENGIYNKLISVPLLEDIMPYLLAIHTQNHINQIERNYADSHEVSLAVVSGVVGAIDMVCQKQLDNAFCATRPPGHHALNTGQEEGFCFYNSIAVAARYAQKQYNMKKILIIDWDYHHGNGTEAAFYSDPSVLFFSTHDLYAYPGTGYPDKTGEGEGKGFNINIHLGCGTRDEDIVQVYEERLIPVAEKFKPDMILISAGFDSRKDDLLGCYEISDEGFVKLTRIVMALADTFCNGRLVSILEGGYNIQGNASAALHHIKTLLH